MIRQIVLLLIGLVSINSAQAQTGPMLVIDALNQPGLPSNFRATSDVMPPNSAVNLQGLDRLFIVGSAQFSANELVAVINKIKAPIIVVDLRQESHGFVNDNAVSWYSARDWANLGKTPIEVEDDQKSRLNELLAKQEIVLNKITDKSKESEIKKFKATTIPVKNVMNEYGLTRLYKVGYIRIYITDHLAPSNDQIDRFVQLVKSVPKNTWLYFHCRAGKGRTTTFMAMYDMVRNAKQMSFEDILQRQYLLGGIDLTKIPEPNSYKHSLITYRVTLLKKFYEYCKTDQDNFATSWSVWQKNNSSSS